MLSVMDTVPLAPRNQITLSMLVKERSMGTIVLGNASQVVFKTPMYIVPYASQGAFQLLLPFLHAQNVRQEAIPQAMESVLKLCVQDASKECFQQRWVQARFLHVSYASLGCFLLWMGYRNVQVVCLAHIQ